MACNGVVRSPVSIPNFHDIEVDGKWGRTCKLDKYAGKVVVVINVAPFGDDSAKIFQQMNDLQEHYQKNDQVAVLAFPCSQFQHSVSICGSSCKIIHSYSGIDRM